MIVLVYLSGLFIGAAFLAGLLVGNWQQRRVKAVQAAVEIQKEAIKRMIPDDERYDEVPEPTGLGHPGGAAPPLREMSRIGKKERVQDLVRKMGLIK